jgi:arylformamidase
MTAASWQHRFTEGDPMSKLYDVSPVIFPGMVVWPGDAGVNLERVGRMEAGAHSNTSRLSCGTHTGSHVDAPLHFLPDGGTMDSVPLETLIGPAWVAELQRAGRLCGSDLEAAGIPAGVERLLLKTVNSRLWDTTADFHTDYTGLDESGARWVADRGIRLIGVDYLSVAVRDQTGPVHRVLLGRKIVIVEGLNLSGVPAGACRFYCLPLRLRGAEAAPARAVVEMG